MDSVTILGVVAAACTTFSFLPQAIKTIKTKHTKGLSVVTYSVMTFGVFLWRWCTGFLLVIFLLFLLMV